MKTVTRGLALIVIVLLISCVGNSSAETPRPTASSVVQRAERWVEGDITQRERLVGEYDLPITRIDALVQYPFLACAEVRASKYSGWQISTEQKDGDLTVLLSNIGPGTRKPFDPDTWNEVVEIINGCGDYSYGDR